MSEFHQTNQRSGCDPMTAEDNQQRGTIKVSPEVISAWPSTSLLL